ncbi:hypothetical protein [Streptomyces microflavus]|uniref:hypothetical protein n=1 Tax=Streptomyces microflavus TaxID=1919 RepID=UPI003B217065
MDLAGLGEAGEGVVEGGSAGAGHGGELVLVEVCGLVSDGIGDVGKGLMIFSSVLVSFFGGGGRRGCRGGRHVGLAAVLVVGENGL